MEVTLPSSPATNLAFEADLANISQQLTSRRPRAVPSLLTQSRREAVLPTATTLEFDQNIGKWCLKNLTGSKSFDQQLESGVIEVANNNLGCLRRVITWEYFSYICLSS